MAVLKSKPKSMKAALKGSLVDDEDLLSHDAGTPKVLQSVPKDKVKALTAALEKRAEVLEEEVALKARSEELARQKKEMETLLREVSEQIPGMDDPDHEVEFDLAGLHVEIKKQGTQRELTDAGKKKLLELLDEDDLFKLAQFKLGDLDDYLTAKQRKEVLVVNRTARGLKVTPLTE